MYSPPPHDFDAQRMTLAQCRASLALGVTLDGPPVWGWRGRTVGRLALHPRRGACWLRLLSAPVEEAGGKHWEGTRLAATLFPDVHKPALHAVHDHQVDGVAYRAELTGYVAAPVLARDPVLRHELVLQPPFLRELHADLLKVAAVTTDRLAVRQQWIGRRVPELTGRPAPQIRDWRCAHGDLHPANLTESGALLDWEGFGMAPRGYDAALLYAYSLLAPQTADRIFATFADDLTSPDGRAALLVVAADLLLSASRGDHPDLVPALRDLVDRCA